MKKLKLTLLLSLSLAWTAHSQATLNSKASGISSQKLPIRQVPAGCEQNDATWSRIYLVTRMERDMNASMLADSTAALQVMRAEQPPKVDAAYKKGKKKGTGTGLKIGIAGTALLIELIRLVLSRS